MARFVFLDRDGTLTRDAGYTHRIEDYALLPGVVEGLARLRAAGFALAIVTNQSGIARGHFDHADYERFRAHLEADLARQGIAIARTYHCPHLPESGCRCRKPEPGLLLRARDQLGADLGRSWVVGDQQSDVELARRAGCAGGILIAPGGAPGTAPDLREAADAILRATEGDG